MPLPAPDTCVLCGCAALRPKFPLQDSILRVCPTCGLQSRAVHMSTEECAARYSDDAYFRKHSTSDSGQYGYNDYLKNKHLYAWYFRERLDDLEARTPVGRLLDVGCATGVLLEMARLRGWDVAGVDLSAFATGIAREYYNLDVFQGLLQDADFAPASFDVITMDDFIEHVADPVATVRYASTLLKPGGLLSVNTPNCGGWYARLMRASWFHYKQQEHFYFFNHQTIRRLMAAAGLTLTEVSPSARVVDMKYLATRLNYYRNTPPTAFLRALTGRLRTGRVAFFLRTGEMVAYATKPGA